MLVLRNWIDNFAIGATLLKPWVGSARSWRDQEHNKFAEEFDEQLKQVQRLVERSELHIPYLLKKAELIEQYLQR